MAAQLLDKAVQLVFHHGVGQLDVHGLQHLADQVIGELLGGLGLLFLHRRLHDGPAQGRDIGKALPAGEIIVPLRHGPPGDLVDLDMEHRVLAGQLRRVGGGEGDMDVALLAARAPATCSSKPGMK